MLVVCGHTYIFGSFFLIIRDGNFTPIYQCNFSPIKGYRKRTRWNLCPDHHDWAKTEFGCSTPPQVYLLKCHYIFYNYKITIMTIRNLIFLLKAIISTIYPYSTCLSFFLCIIRIKPQLQSTKYFIACKSFF